MIDSRYNEMQFRRSIAPPKSYEWVHEIRKDLEGAHFAIECMLGNKKGLIRKDRHELAETFHNIALVLEKKTIEGTVFNPKHAK